MSEMVDVLCGRWLGAVLCAAQSTYSEVGVSGHSYTTGGGNIIIISNYSAQSHLIITLSLVAGQTRVNTDQDQSSSNFLSRIRSKSCRGQQ